MTTILSESAAARRTAITFRSGADDCAAWHYRGSNGACVVMAGGAGVTKEPATDRFAARFHAAGYSVLAFDHRHFGGSGGMPRQVLRVREQLADWQAALDCAASLPGVTPGRVAGWGFSLAGGHLLRLAAQRSGRTRLAAVIAQAPQADGLVSMPYALRHESAGVLARFPLFALRDVARGLAGREPLLVPLAGPRGAVAMLTTPDAADGDRALNPGNAYPEWRQSIAARSVIPLGLYRPATAASRIGCPLLAVISTHDQAIPAGPARKAARRAPRAEILEVDGGHYAAFFDQHETVVTAELNFLDRHLLQGGHGAAAEPTRRHGPRHSGGTDGAARALRETG
ncbi:MAG TPA: alpha/beta fold hydrolase [Streptosporangiaceae bacterium]